jgi:uncharacterized lipoprotein YehR (DUF1307 family)
MEETEQSNKFQTIYNNEVVIITYSYKDDKVCNAQIEYWHNKPYFNGLSNDELKLLAIEHHIKVINARK